jgi:hypothetical protein
MDELVPFFLNVIKDAPGYFVLTIAFIVAVFYIHTKVRSINMDEIATIGNLQSEQVAKLLVQVSQLSRDLAEARREILSLYNKIDELETVIRVYKNKLGDVDVDEAQA